MDVDDTSPQDTVTSGAQRRRNKAANNPVEPTVAPPAAAAAATQPIEGDEDDTYRTVDLKRVSGGTLTHDAVVFSSDSSLFFLAKDNALAVYNVENAEIIQSIAIKHIGKKKMAGQATTIHAIVADPSQTEGRRGVYTFCADSSARLWDADTGCLVSEWRLPGGSAVYAEADPTRINAFYCAMRQPAAKNQRPNLDKARYMISRITLVDDGSVQTEALFKMTGVVGLCVRGDSEWVAAYSKFRVVLAQVRGGSGQVVQHTWSMTERVSTLAFHPAEPVLAVGDWRGRIVFWHCVDEQLVGIQPTTDLQITRNSHHWHAHRVNSVAFAESGTTMLSGGEEGVLVLWQLVTGSRSFVPRLGSDIMG
ncbi:NET1-associated nuclear protein 1, partial [Coemansia aciculifera]